MPYAICSILLSLNLSYGLVFSSRC